MAVEFVGLAIGILSLTKDCIEILEYVSVAKSFGRDRNLARTKIDLEKAYLLRWAERVRLATPNYDRRLDEAAIGQPIAQALTSIRDLFRDASVLEDRYGIKESDKVGNKSGDVSLSAKRAFEFHEHFKALSLSTRQEVSRISKISTFKKMRWAVHDKAKFDTLVADLSYLSSRINDLMPDESGRIEKMIREDFTGLTTQVTASRLLLNAASGHGHAVEASAAALHEKNCQKRIVDQRWFRSMNERRDKIDPPCPKTFEWVLDSSATPTEWSDLSQWLRDGSGIYWICGKAAAGKSTLMKHLQKHQRTQTCLKAWANGSYLTIASFFFLYLGTEDQKSHAGLSRAILYNIIDSEPALIHELLPSLWREVYDKGSEEFEVPSQSEMKYAFSIFGSATTKHKFCFFVDGLDEYDGNYTEAISLLKNLTKNVNAKIVVSSRPIAACHEAFNQCPMLKLEALNRPDIETYVQSVVGADDNLQSLRHSCPEDWQKIIDGLIQKAEGVFLWVVLACRSVVAGLVDGDYIHEIMKRVDELPHELEDLFMHIVNRIEKRYRDEAVKLLRIAYQNQLSHGRNDRLSTFALSIMAEHNFDLSAIAELDDIPVMARRGKCLQLEKRLRSRCRGLLEVSTNVRRRPDSLCACLSQANRDETLSYSQTSHDEVTGLSQTSYDGSMSLSQTDHDELIDSSVKFLHRTVFDFLNTSDKWTPPDSDKTDILFDPSAAVACHSLYMKWWTHTEPNPNVRWTHFVLEPIMEAPSVGHHAGVPVLRKFGQMADLLWHPNGKMSSSSALYTQLLEAVPSTVPDRCLVIALLIVVQLGTPELLTVYWQEYRRKHSNIPQTKLPLLYYAIDRPIVARLPKWTSPDFSNEIVQILLSVGCDPNSAFKRHTSTAASAPSFTPWKRWLRQCADFLFSSSVDPDSARRVLETTTAFVDKRADLSLVTANLEQSWSEWVVSMRAGVKHSVPPDSQGVLEDFDRAAEELMAGILRVETNADTHGRKRSGSQTLVFPVRGVDEDVDADGGRSLASSGAEVKRRRM